MLLGWVFLTVAGLALVRGKAATCASEESLNVRLRGFTVQHTITPAWISCLPSKSIHISCRISALTLGFFLLGLDVNTWLLGVLQAEMLKGNVRGGILSTDFQLVTLFLPSFLTPSLYCLSSLQSLLLSLFIIPTSALQVTERF